MVVQQRVSATTHNRHKYIVRGEVVRVVEDTVNLLFAFDLSSQFYDTIDLKN
jgi:hypothetical protein